MAVLTAVQVADAWVAAGGPKSRAVEFVAIAMGESSLDDTAESSAGAQGLWQVMPFWWGSLGLDPNMWSDPLTNARAAVAISGHGTNCAAWDSCYTDIYTSGRLQFLAWPQSGSADYNNLPAAAAALGQDKIGGAAPPPGPSNAPAVAHAVAQLQGLATKVYPSLDKLLIANRMEWQALYR